MLRTRAATGVVILFMLLGSAPLRAQDSPHIGVKVRTLTLDLRKQHKLPEDAKGALVTGVTPGGPAQKQGIVSGEVIVEADGKPIATAKDVADRIATPSASGAGTIALRVMNQKGERREVTVAIEKGSPGGSKAVLPDPK
jgi:serine protease Do